MLPTTGGDQGRPDLTLKICLAGDPAVGKSSLVKRFVSDTFDERYVSTLGAKVSSRRFSFPDPEGPAVIHHVGATIWDIMGNVGFRELLKDAYFYKVQGVLLVCDGTRPETFHSLPAWFAAVRSVAGAVPAIVLLNKSDLMDQTRVSPKELEEVCITRGWRWLPTSAKTGENVGDAFVILAQLYLKTLNRPAAEVTAEG